MTTQFQEEVFVLIQEFLSVHNLNGTAANLFEEKKFFRNTDTTTRLEGLLRYALQANNEWGDYETEKRDQLSRAEGGDQVDDVSKLIEENFSMSPTRETNVDPDNSSRTGTPVLIRESLPPFTKQSSSSEPIAVPSRNNELMTEEEEQFSLTSQGASFAVRSESGFSLDSQSGISFLSDEEEQETPEADIEEWSDDDDPGYRKVPFEDLEEVFKYSDDESEESAKEKREWRRGAQESTNNDDGTTEMPYSPPNLPPEEFEVEKLDELLNEHIQIQRDEFYQESVGPKYWPKSDSQPSSTTSKEDQSETPVVSLTYSPEPTEPNELFERYPNPQQKSETPVIEQQSPAPQPQPVYESFDLKIISTKGRTGFEEHKDFPIEINSIIAGRYHILEYIGAAAFSHAVRCEDLMTHKQVCIKIIKNNKEFFDQSLDEIRLLHYINLNCVPDEKNVLCIYDYFYHKEHLFLVCELLRDNLYEFYKFNRESGEEYYFNIDRLRIISRQCLVALEYVHSLNLIHCDLKPENILMKSYSRCEVKIIDFGSSCFLSDHLSSYVQSRSYRAPEVILGLPYNQKIDLWSLGCILAELWTSKVLFHNESIATLLARMIGVLGPFDEEMIKQGRYSDKYFTKEGKVFEQTADGKNFLLVSKKTSLKNRLKCPNPLFIDFIASMLRPNPDKRVSATEALNHPFLQSSNPM